MNKGKNRMSNLLCKAALTTAVNSVNVWCLLLLHQPEVPKKLLEKYQDK